MQDRIYGLLPLDVAAQMNRLCDGKLQAPSPLTTLHTMLKEPFAEFMD